MPHRIELPGVHSVRAPIIHPKIGKVLPHPNRIEQKSRVGEIATARALELQLQRLLAHHNLIHLPDAAHIFHGTPLKTHRVHAAGAGPQAPVTKEAGAQRWVIAI